MIKVFHNAKSNFISPRFEDEDLELVAEVRDNDLETAYMLTNHIDEAWYDHPNVECHNRQARSTSIGDVMERNGRRYVVDVVGFKEIKNA